jgi:hypothetical protein
MTVHENEAFVRASWERCACLRFDATQYFNCEAYTKNGERVMVFGPPVLGEDAAWAIAAEKTREILQEAGEMKRVISSQQTDLTNSLANFTKGLKRCE